MAGLSLWLLAIGLSMDSLAVAIAGGIVMKRFDWRPFLSIPFIFGIFHIGMLLAGWWGGRFFASLIEDVDHWVAFAILTYLGGRMVWQALRSQGEQPGLNPAHPGTVLLLTTATSIDALVVGVSFACMGFSAFEQIFPVSLIVGFTVFVFTLAGLLFGAKYGAFCARKIRVSLFGGGILMLIGLKTLLEHLFFS